MSILISLTAYIIGPLSAHSYMLAGMALNFFIVEFWTHVPQLTNTWTVHLSE